MPHAGFEAFSSAQPKPQPQHQYKYQLVDFVMTIVVAVIGFALMLGFVFVPWVHILLSSAGAYGFSWIAGKMPARWWGHTAIVLSVVAGFYFGTLTKGSEGIYIGTFFVGVFALWGLSRGRKKLF